MHLVLQGCKLMHFKLMVCKVLENLKAGTFGRIICFTATK